MGRGSGSQVVVLVKSDPSFAAIFEEGTLVVGATVSGTVFGEGVSIKDRTGSTTDSSSVQEQMLMWLA